MIDLSAPLAVPVWVGIAGGVVLLVSLVVGLRAQGSAARSERRLDRLLRGPGLENVESVLAHQAEQIQALAHDVARADGAVTTTQAAVRGTLRRVGAVRYNAFPDTGSDLSFSLAVLDDDANGFILTSLYGRDESRVYLKPVASGSSTYHLSDEERRALEQAGPADRPR